MNILQVTPSFYPATFFGGPIFSTLGLCDALAQSGNIRLRVLTTDTAGPAKGDRLERMDFPVRFPAGYEVYYCRKVFGKDISPEMFMRLLPMLHWADVVHLTGVYSPPTLPTLLACRLLGKPVVWSPRGALQRWEGSSRPFAKRVWESVCNALLQPERNMLHVTSEAEAVASRKRMPKAKIEIIPNGVDLPPLNPNRVWQPDGRLRLLYLGRLNPIKGLENLLEAIALMQAENVMLTICGDGEPEYVKSLMQKVGALSLAGCVEFKGHVSGAEKTKAFEEADICVMPSFTENFGMVVAESLAHGVPVVVSKGAPWAEIEQRGCGLWVDNSPSSLAAAIRAIRKRGLAEMGAHGRSWMAEDFSWHRIATQMFDHYQRLAAATGSWRE